MLGATVQPDLAFLFYAVSLPPLTIMGQIAMAMSLPLFHNKQGGLPTSKNIFA
jgi:hypothetical protein